MIKAIKRYNELNICDNANSILIFGRRKVGKTFFVKNYLNYDNYFFVGKNDVVFFDNEELSYESFFSLFKIISKDKVVVVDEFHRLPQYFLDYVHYNKPKKMILLTSTLWLATKMLENKDSSLLGIVTPVKFSIVSEIDVVNNLLDLGFSEVDLFENAVYLREPILIDYYNGDIFKTVTGFLYNQKYYLKNLIGEIFSEEQRRFSRVYEGILLAISSGKNVSGEISSFLFSKKLLDKDSPSLIQKHLGILVNLGLIEKIQVYNKSKFFYLITSPLLDLYFYLNVKYDYVEQDIPISFVEEVVRVKMPFHVEIFFRNLLSKLRGMKVVKIDNPEVDISLLRFNSLNFLAEVKWRNDYKNKGDVIYDNLSQFDVNDMYIISKTRIKSKIKQLDLKDLVEMIKRGVM